MRVLIFGALIIFNFTLQATIFTYIEILQVAPNTALLIVVAYAMLRDDVEGAIVGFFTGLLIDIVFGQIIGFYALFYALIGFFCAKPFKDFVRENYLLPIALTIASVITLESITFGAMFALRGNAEFFYYLRTRILPATIYTVMLSVPIYMMVYRINKALEKRYR